MKKTYTLCDHPCELKDSCARYLPNLDRRTTDHFAISPFKNGKCNFYEPLDADDIIDKVNQWIQNKNN